MPLPGSIVIGNGANHSSEQLGLVAPMPKCTWVDHPHVDLEDRPYSTSRCSLDSSEQLRLLDSSEQLRLEDSMSTSGTKEGCDIRPSLGEHSESRSPSSQPSVQALIEEFITGTRLTLTESMQKKHCVGHSNETRANDVVDGSVDVRSEFRELLLDDVATLFTRGLDRCEARISELLKEQSDAIDMRMRAVLGKSMDAQTQEFRQLLEKHNDHDTSNGSDWPSADVKRNGTLQSDREGGTLVEPVPSTATNRAYPSRLAGELSESIAQRSRTVSCSSNHTAKELERVTQTALSKQKRGWAKREALTHNGLAELMPMSWLPQSQLLVRFVQWLDSKEPEREGRLAAFVQGKVFESVCVIVILANAAHTTYSLDQSCSRAKHGQSQTDTTIPDLCFFAFYTSELSLRILVHRSFFFFHGSNWGWNIFDIALVIQAALDLFLQFLAASPSEGNMWWFRQTRFLRIAKVLRTLRAVRFLSELRLMMMCIIQSFACFVWCLALLVFVQYVFSMVFVQGTAYYLEDNFGDLQDDTAESLYESFGTVLGAILSLGMAATGGQDWIVYYDMLRATALWRAWAFLLYIAFFVIAALNIVTGTFVNKAFSLAKPDTAGEIAVKRAHDMEHVQALEELFAQADIDGSGKITRDELVALIEVEDHAILEFLGVAHVDAESLCELLGADSGGTVTIETFVMGLLMMSGSAKNIDVHLTEHRILSAVSMLLRAFGHYDVPRSKIHGS